LAGDAIAETGLARLPPAVDNPHDRIVIEAATKPG
jgi:hypothetical protein